MKQPCKVGNGLRDMVVYRREPGMLNLTQVFSLVLCVLGCCKIGSRLQDVVCRQEGGELDLTEVPGHEAALQGAMALAKQAAAGDRFTPSQLTAASEVLAVPCAAMGVLLCMQHSLQDRRMWSGALEMLPAPAFLALMLVLVPLQPQMNAKVRYLRLKTVPTVAADGCCTCTGGACCK